MTMRLSKLFGIDIYTDTAEYRGKIFDLVINLEKGKIETITTEALRARSKAEAKKIITEKSIPYGKVKAVKDIVIVGAGKSVPIRDNESEEQTSRQPIYRRPVR